jgi:bacteriorhodopsin
MKLFSTFALFAAAAAQDDVQGDGAQGQGAQGQGAQGQGAQVQGAQDSGYGAEQQPEAYGAEQSYGEAAPDQSYGEAHYAPVYKPKMCVGLCPASAPYYNLDTGACAPGVCATSSYSAPASYAAPASGYRRLEESDNSYGYEAPAQQAPAAQQNYAAPAVEQSYAAPVQSYAAPVASYEAPPCELVAPHGNYVDTRFNRVSRGGRIALWVGFALLFLPAVFFINRYLAIVYLEEVEVSVDIRVGSFVGKRILKFIAEPALFCGVVCFIASIAYLAMATGHGYYVRCCDGREFYYARYLDWIITTPLMLHGIVYLGGFDNDTWTYLFFQDILMIAAGLIGSTTCTSDKWIFFAFSMLNFIPILYYICAEMKRELDTQIYDENGNVVQKIALDSVLGATIPHIWFWLSFKRAANLLVLVWSIYPIVWILAEGTGVISSNGEAIFYTVLDVIAKSAFGYLIAFAQKNSMMNLKKSKVLLNNSDDKYLKALDDMMKEANKIAKSSSSAL